MSAKRDLPRRYEIAIERLSHEGRGVGRYAGKAVFVADALPGEQVVVNVVRRHRRYDEAVTAELIKSDPARVAPRCPHAALCGGCSLQHLEPEAQIAHKQRVLLELLRHQAAVLPEEILPPIRGPLWGYRRRARLSVRVVPKKGGALIGFREKSSHYVTAIDHCAVLVPGIGTRMQALREVINALSMAEHIPQIEVAAGDNTTVLAIRHLAPLTADDLASLARFEDDTGLKIYLQAGNAATLHPVSAEATLDYTIDDLRFTFAPGDFIQINGAINRELVRAARQCLAPAPEDTVLDLFCGIGNFSLPLARHASRVIGVESDPNLIHRARDNAVRNAIDNAEFLRVDLGSETGIQSLAGLKFNKLLLDPPRSGAEVPVRSLCLHGVSRIVYISCNPVTLARDTAILVRERGLRLRAAGVIDMFPHTAHVESLAVFEPK